MSYKSMMDGIIFIEGNYNCVNELGPVKYTKDNIFNSQLKNLDYVKEQLAYKAHKMGANAIINFTYGQKSRGLLGSLFLINDDNIEWYADGTAVIIDDDSYKKLVSQFEERE